MCWTRGKGRVFYFRPGHEEFPIFFQPEVMRIVRNAALWAARDETAIWIDNDPAAGAAHAAGEPSLAEICLRTGYAGTDITAPGLVKVASFVKAGPGLVRTYPLAAYGLAKECTAGWYVSADKPDKRSTLWKVDDRRNKEDNPPTESKGKITFDPADKPFGLWVSTKGFKDEYVCLDDDRNAAIARFGGKPIQKARVYAAVSSNGTALPNTYLIGWEYSTNDDFQDIVTVVENVRPAGG